MRVNQLQFIRLVFDFVHEANRRVHRNDVGSNFVRCKHGRPQSTPTRTIGIRTLPVRSRIHRSRRAGSVVIRNSVELKKQLYAALQLDDVMYYLWEDRFQGVLLWSTWNPVDPARELLGRLFRPAHVTPPGI
jgi:hypothetical protein